MYDLVKIGTPYHHVFLDDITALDSSWFSSYKLVIFLNCYNMTNAQRSAVSTKLKNNNRVLMWCYAPGYFNGKNASLANMSNVTGITLATPTGDTYVAPRITASTSQGSALAQAIINKGFTTAFGPTVASGKRISVTDGTATIVGLDSAGHCTMASKSMGTWTSLYCSTPNLPAGVLREIVRWAGGIFLFEDYLGPNKECDTVYASNFFVTVHAKGAGNRTVYFPTGNNRIWDAVTQTYLGTASSYTSYFNDGETRIFQYS
jgi:hypothetical protein